MTDSSEKPKLLLKKKTLMKALALLSFVLSIFIAYSFLPFHSKAITSSTTLKEDEPSLVYVHIGSKLPSYLPTSIAQARLFNSDIKIYLISSQTAYDEYDQFLTASHIIFISLDSLKKSRQHREFNRKSRLNKEFREGFWHCATERFFYLEEWIEQGSLSNVVHIENDVMLYTALKELMPVFSAKYPGIAATFDNDRRVIPGFLFIKNSLSIQKLTQFINSRTHKSENDMQLLAKFKSIEGGKYIDHLPIIPPQYADGLSLVSTKGRKAKKKDCYYKNYDLFSSIFDAAALGQYLGGIDPIHTSMPTVGFINESCVFNPSEFTFEWVLDEVGRKVPYAIFNGQPIKINNLHIHCKALPLFYSLPLPAEQNL